MTSELFVTEHGPHPFGALEPTARAMRFIACHCRGSRGCLGFYWTPRRRCANWLARHVYGHGLAHHDSHRCKVYSARQ